MRTLMKKTLFVILAALTISLEAFATPTIISTEMIWSQAPYSAFTDLIYFNDCFYCCFRESNSHEGGEDGKIRILKSGDAKKWESVALLSLEGYDLRDPKLSLTPDGKLMLNMGATVWNGNEQTIHSAVSFSLDGVEWETVQVILTEQWLWHVTWNEEIAYGAAYSSNGPNSTALSLMNSTDGINYTTVKEFNLPNSSPTEATLRFLPDETMVMLLRRNNNAPGLIGSSRPPYNDWKWFNTQSILGGPDFLILDDGTMWASSRQTCGEEEICILASMSLDAYDPILTLPSEGDCSYPGMVYKDGKLYISYYSSQTGKACIYLAIVKL